MTFFRRTAFITLLALTASCSGGGNSGGGVVGASWPKFRRDSNNSAQAFGLVANNQGTVKASVELNGSVSASPAINIDNTVYIATENCTGAGCNSNSGTLVAVDGTAFGVRWRTQSNSKCQDSALGAMISSPAVTTLNGNTTVIIGSQSGRVHSFIDTSTATQPSSVFCFEAPQTRFTSSASLLLSTVSGAIDAIFIGAEVTVDGTKQGRLYALANDGSIKWQFPQLGDAPIAPITSSPGVSAGALYVISDDGQLYALSLDGKLKWSRRVGNVRDPEALFAVSPITLASGIFVGTLDGTLMAINPDGSERWHRSDPSRVWRGSLAFGGLPPTPEPTATTTPLESPTPVPTATGAATASPTPTATPIALLSTSSVFAVTRSGELVVYNAAAPTPAAPTPGVTVEGEVIGSPALSGDGQIVFASSTDTRVLVYVIDVLTGLPPATPTGTPSPAPWPKAVAGTGIVSSPVVANDGTIWIATNDGKLYAIGTK